MTEFILKIYDYMKSHRARRILSFVALTSVMLLLVSRLDYKEDIADFLPVDSNHQNALKVYQDISGGNKIFAVFQYRDSSKADPDMMCECVDRFVDEVHKADTAHEAGSIMAQVDLEQMAEVAGFVYDNIPLFLSDADYARIDSLLSTPGFIQGQLATDKQMLMFPTGSLLSDNIQRDPLNLFTPTVQKLQRDDSELKYEMYDGHIFSPDMQRAIVVIDSPYGASETEHNARLTQMLTLCATKATSHYGNVDISIIGGPVIAVGNASQIKADSLLSVGIAVALILLLLLVSFRNWRNLLLIVLSIAWGWLFAMGGLALVHDRVSVIVIGISSVILGIAVNYPLHFIAHLSHTPNRRKALREIVMPLLVGNITTVGAFLTLVPLQSVALRDLGLFSSLLLVGTIVFVLLYLPHITRAGKAAKPTFLDRVSGLTLDDKPAVVVSVLVLTLVFGFFSLNVKFDSNIAHINYMTDEQKADMEYFQRTMTTTGALQKVYAISTDSTIDGALDKSLRLQPQLEQLKRQHRIVAYSGCNQFICSQAEQKRRLALWHGFVCRNAARLKAELAEHAAAEGFSADSFDDFYKILDNDYGTHGLDYFKPLVNRVFASNISTDTLSRKYNVVNILSVTDDAVGKVERSLDTNDCYSFDVASMNSAIANHLSNDFNYIGFACGFIVFFFLWLSLGSIELATLSFVPMAVSWLWILGIMSLLDIQFNIVNIILATFIFGQGDDYTIFMTEGASYEYAYRRKMLTSYKHSIIISALIMFIGIGTLIVARHPALHSLAEVTIAGMFSVVLMAYIFPPLIFRFLVSSSRGSYRIRPVSLRPVSVMAWWSVLRCCQHAVLRVAGALSGSGVVSGTRLLGLAYSQCRFAITHIPGVKCHIEDGSGQALRHPVIMVASCRSRLEAVALMALRPHTVLVGTDKALCIAGKSGVCPGFVTLTTDFDRDLDALRERVAHGCNLALIADSAAGTAVAVRIAAALDIAVVPVVMHGFSDVMPQGGFMLFPGTVTVRALPLVAGEDAEQTAALVEQSMATGYDELATSRQTAAYYHHLVLDRYRYKGADVYAAVKKSLKLNADYADRIDGAADCGRIVVLNSDHGEFALLYALVHPHCVVAVAEPDDEKRELIRYCADGIAPNMVLCGKSETNELFKIWEEITE